MPTLPVGLPVAVDHACQVARAHELGLLAGSPVELSWCLYYHRDLLAGPDPVETTDPRLLSWEGGPLRVYYAPWDWVNTAARVMLVGITPGAFQAAAALREAQRCLRASCSAEEDAPEGRSGGSFSGPMRANLVAMLDGTGLADALAADSTARLFDTHHHLASLVSAIDYPVFVDSGNYGGISVLAWAERVAGVEDGVVPTCSRGAELKHGVYYGCILLGEQQPGVRRRPATRVPVSVMTGPVTRARTLAPVIGSWLSVWAASSRRLR